MVRCDERVGRRHVGGGGGQRAQRGDHLVVEHRQSPDGRSSARRARPPSRRLRRRPVRPQPAAHRRPRPTDRPCSARSRSARRSTRSARRSSGLSASASTSTCRSALPPSLTTRHPGSRSARRPPCPGPPGTGPRTATVKRRPRSVPRRRHSRGLRCLRGELRQDVGENRQGLADPPRAGRPGSRPNANRDTGPRGCREHLFWRWRAGTSPHTRRRQLLGINLQHDAGTRS